MVMLNMGMSLKQKGSGLTESYDKSLYIQRKLLKAKLQHKTHATTNFEYMTIADRLRMVNWSDDSHLTDIVKPVYGIPTFQLT